jgi:hypothetical protein
MPSCNQGPRESDPEGEDFGSYDQYGNFVRYEWKCVELGHRSKPACEFLDKQGCKHNKDRCVYGRSNGTDKCMARCDNTYDAGQCGQMSHCMWFQDKCQPGCGSESKCPSDRCVSSANNTKCTKACWAYSERDACPLDQACIWEDFQCKDDPCSSPDEDCSDTKCCSHQRGGQGMTCFKKDQYWSVCKESCFEDDWACDALGNRTKLEAGCAWPGEDCLSDRLCCQEGFQCAKKDDMFTGCVQTKEKHTWMDKDVPIPSDWEGTIYGGCRAEYEVQPVGEDEEKAGNKLFCFMAYLPDSAEVPLKDLAKELKASIYGCDIHSVYESWQSGASAWDTGEATITNTDVFVNVWNQMAAEGKWKEADWTVKVDPDAVLVAERLKWHLDALRAPPYQRIYLKNNGMDPGLGNNGFLGAIEIFSKGAVEIYLDNYEGCVKAYGLDTGEDGFFKGCMDSLGVGFMTDVNIFKPDFSPGACTDGDMVGYHPLKEASQWRCCWDLVNGKNRKVDFGKCDMGPDGMGPTEEVPDYVMPDKGR